MTPTAETITLSFSANNKRFFLDEVKLSADHLTTATVTLNKYGFATYCSANPIDFSSTTGYTAWRVTGVSDDVITLTKITEKIKGGQGVLLYNKDADGEHTSEVTIHFADSDMEFSGSENKLVGTTAPTNVADGVYYGLSGNGFKAISAGNVPAHKAILPVSAAGARLSFVFEDESAGITDVKGKMDDASGDYYNLNGQKVQNPTRGFYIVRSANGRLQGKNGKKVLFK